MLIRLAWVGRTRDAAAVGWIEEYRKRISRFCPVEVVEIRDAAGRGRSRAARETRDLADRLAGRGLTVTLDEGGDEMDSAGFARFLERALETRGEVTFLLGGPEGLDEANLPSSGKRLALSRMTLTHEMARVVLLEQIYRAFTILRGAAYHR